MSSAEQSSVNSESIEQTKQQIRGLVGEIVQLSKSDLGPDEYYPAILQRIVQALAAVGGAVWVNEEGGGLKLVYQINLSDTLLNEQSDDAIRHFRLLEHIAGTNQPQLVPPLSGPADERAGGNPTRYLLVLAPMVSDAAVEGVIEIFQRPDSQPATQRGYLKFLLQMCEQIGEWLKTRKLRQFSDRHSLWAQADQFSRTVHSTLELKETTYTIVNEGRRLIGCDRVSLALKIGNKCIVKAISGQDTLDDRSNIVSTLGNLATKVVATGEPLYYNGNTADMPPQLEEAVHHYVDESYAKTVTVLPLRKPGEMIAANEREAAQDRSADRDVLGALIIEQIEADVPREVFAPKVDLVYEHTCRAISNSLEHNNLFLMPVWRTLGKASWVVKTRTLPKTLAITGVVLATLIALCVVPYPFNMVAKGALQPVDQREVFVPEKGRIDKLLVKDGDDVNEGDVLAELSSDELDLQIKQATGELDVSREQLKSVIQRLSDLRGTNKTDEAKLTGEASTLEVRHEAKRRELQLLMARKDALKIVAPMKGKVVLSWDVEKQLRNRPVERGQSLMSVANTDGDWELELFMPERRTGHVKTAEKALKDGKKLPVTYILATDPNTKRKGQVFRIHDTTEMHDQEGHTVRVRVQLDEGKEALMNPRPGASATAEVYCGQTAIGNAFLHEAFEFLEKSWFTWF